MVDRHATGQDPAIQGDGGLPVGPGHLPGELPYLGWNLFALVLNATIAASNRPGRSRG